MNTLENALVRALNEAADRNAPDDGLVDRLLTSVQDDLIAPRRLPGPRRRTTTLLMAAAVAVIVVVGVLIGSRFAAQRPSPITPPITPAPSPTLMSSPAGSPTSVPSSAPMPSTGGSLTPTESFITTRVASTGTPVGFTLDSVSFRSAEQGMALGTAPCPDTAGSSDPSLCGVLVTTADGGLSWSSLTVPQGADVPGTESCPSWADNRTSCTSRLNLTDPAAGYLWGPRQIYRTTDTGASWQQLTVGTGTVTQLVSVQGRAFVATVPTQSADWSQATLREAGPRDTALKGSTTSAGTEFGTAELIQGPGIVYRWLNGGQTPRVQATTSGVSWSDLPKAAPRAFTTFAAGDGSLVSDVSGSDAVAQVLPVGGTSWRTIPRPPAPSGERDAQVSYSLAGAVSAREIAVAISGFESVAGGGQAWITTSDGGRTWDAPVLFSGEALALGVQVGQFAVDGELITPWSLGTALLRSSDNGNTWTQVDFPRS